MTSSRSRPTLAELMVLVAVCAVGLGLLRTAFFPFGVAIVLIVPGILVDRARGGRGVVGALLSTCLLLLTFLGIPAVVRSMLSVGENPLVMVLPILCLLAAVRLSWSSSPSRLFCNLDRRMQGRKPEEDPEFGRGDPEFR